MPRQRTELRQGGLQVQGTRVVKIGAGFKKNSYMMNDFPYTFDSSLFNHVSLKLKGTDLGEECVEPCAVLPEAVRAHEAAGHKARGHQTLGENISKI